MNLVPKKNFWEVRRADEPRKLGQKQRGALGRGTPFAFRIEVNTNAVLRELSDSVQAE